MAPALDKVTTKFQIRCVQQDIQCLRHNEKNLDSSDQLPYGLLNACLKHCHVLQQSRWNLPSQLNRCAGSISLLNRKTALCHSGCRNMGGSPSGDAVASGARGHKTPRREKENVSPLTDAKRKRAKRPVVANMGVERKARPCSSRGQIHHTTIKRGHSDLDVVEISGNRTAWKPRDNRWHQSEDCGFHSIRLRLDLSQYLPRGIIARMKLIPLTQGKSAIVDDCDYDSLSRFKWHFLKDIKGSSEGYAVRNARVGSKRLVILMHRVILKTPDGQETDHKDGNGLHNWRSNLRVCSRALNQRNRATFKNNKIGIKGVNFCSKTGKFNARIYLNRKCIFVGSFGTADEAVAARLKAEREHHRDYARK